MKFSHYGGIKLIKNGIYFCLVIVLLIVSGCTNQSTSETEKLQDQLKEHEQKIRNLKNDHESRVKSLEEESNLSVKSLEEENDAYKAFIQKSIDYLDKNELLALAKSEWHYSIKINDDLVPADGEAEVNKNNFEIVYSEEQSRYQALPNEIHIQGMISGDYFDHLILKDVKPNNIKSADGTIVTAIIYEFKNVPSDTVVEFKVSDELKERLRLTTNLINVKVN